MRFAAKKGEMVTENVVKTKFSQLIDKTFYFSKSSLSLHFGHPSWKELDEYKK